MARAFGMGLRNNQHVGLLFGSQLSPCAGIASEIMEQEPIMKSQRIATATAVAALLFSTAAFAQTPAAQPGPNNNAVNSSGQNNSNAPVEGRNSFTESQAKSRIEKAGYTNVTALKKDKDGIWRGKAAKGGTTTNVTVDFQGNVNAAN